MFHVGFGSAKREAEIRKFAAADRTTALILAAVHFEWMLKRAILKLGASPTKSLRNQLEDVFRMQKHNGRDGYKEVWDREVGKRFKNGALGTVLGKLNQIQSHALDVRGKIIHGNGTVSKSDSDQAIELFLGAGVKLREFAAKHGIDLDARLKTRTKPKVASA
ncbi:hypothetical protein [Pseudorhodoplanes sp.]|uniref:hypothetical protein n=1 Tax=Pseudorhodoplanes sp. TaxID=1934341 RepID=UPI00391B0AB6